MKPTQKTLATVLIICILGILPACSGCKSSTVTPEEVAAASKAGRNRAIELRRDSHIATDTLSIENILLDIREREARLRRNGYDAAADAYITAFLTALDSVNPALAAQLR